MVRAIERSKEGKSDIIWGTKNFGARSSARLVLVSILCHKNIKNLDQVGLVTKYILIKRIEPVPSD